MTTTSTALLEQAAAVAADDEVVTRALSRDVELPLERGDHGSDHAGQRP